MKANTNKSPHGDEPETKTKKKAALIHSENSGSEEFSEEPKGSNRKKVGTACQDSNYYVTSRDKELNGGLSLSGKRAKPNNSGPVLQNAKMDKGERLKAKKQTIQEPKQKKAGETAAETAKSREVGQDILTGQIDTGPPSTSTPRESSNEEKEITRHTPDDKILETFQSKDLTTKDWNKLADQVLKRGVQKAAEEILKSSNEEEEHNTLIPMGFSDESGDGEPQVRRSDRSTKDKGPARYGNPYEHSVKLISTEEDLADLNMAELEAYRVKLANFRTDVHKPEESKLGLLEKHLFRRKIGSEALDVSKSWNAS